MLEEKDLIVPILLRRSLISSCRSQYCSSIPLVVSLTVLYIACTFFKWYFLSLGLRQIFSKKVILTVSAVRLMLGFPNLPLASSTTSLYAFQ